MSTPQQYVADVRYISCLSAVKLASAASPYPSSAQSVLQMQLLFCFGNSVPAGAVPDGNKGFL